MQLKTIFQLSIFGLVSLSSLTLSLAEQGPIAAFTLPVALLALFFSERWKSVGLPQVWANVLGLIAFGAAFIELTSGHEEARLLAGAHLLVYLTWVALFQPKTMQLYWWMFALSVLQMAVASVLAFDPEVYGGLLLTYLLAGVWTLSVFSLFQAEQQFATTASERDAGFPTERTDRGASTPGSLMLQASTTRGTIQRDPSMRWINPPFVAGMLATVAGSLVIAAAFFLLIPRLWLAYRPMNPRQQQAARPLTGFTKEVQLGDLGQILESTDNVLAVKLFDHQTNEELDVEDYAMAFGYDEPLFRGTTLGVYEEGRWEPGSTFSDTPPEISVAKHGMVRQEVTRQPIGTEILFVMHPVISCFFADEDAVERPQFDSTNLRVYEADGEAAKSPIKYVAFSPKPGPDASATEFPPVRGEFPEARLDWWLRDQFTKLPSTGLERLKQTARTIVGARPGAAPVRNQREAARKLVAYLRDSQEFEYSLDASIIDVNIDPVEDFLFNRKSGHCEYYASALALMLRAVGIPSRLVSGFKGCEQNMFTAAFEVQQRHAHAWVEAHIDGRWVSMDATPSLERTRSVEDMASGPATWRDLVSISSESWQRYVVNLNYVQQYRSFYQPMREASWTAWDFVAGNSEDAQSAWSAVVGFATTPRRWLSWQGGLVTLILVAAVASFAWIARRVSRRWGRSWWQRRRQRHERKIQIEFYERFKKLCAATGLVRPPGQTQREFAVTVHSSWNQTLSHSGLEEFPARLVESFYRVRFGQSRLNPTQAEEIDGQLSRLEQALSVKGRR